MLLHSSAGSTPVTGIEHSYRYGLVPSPQILPESLWMHPDADLRLRLRCSFALLFRLALICALGYRGGVQRLIEGVHRFHADEFGKHRELFQRLAAEGQNPHTLFITCSDSRVLAELITQSQPGDLFVVKNVGNLVPPSEVSGSTNSTAAAIEFAIEVLEVRDVVVCGHSQCGAVRALMNGVPYPDRMRHVQRWLSIADSVRTTVREKYAHVTDPAEQLHIAEEENVLFALDNLRTYPGVRRRLAEGSLYLHAWFFKIATGELFVYNPEPEPGQFVLLQRPQSIS